MFNKNLIKSGGSLSSRVANAPPQSLETFTASVPEIQSCEQVEQELNQRNRELETLHRISTIHLNPRSLQTAFQATVEEISTATGFPIVAIERYDALRQVMIFEGSQGIPLPANSAILEVPVDQTYSGTVVRLKQPAVNIYADGEAKTCDANETLSQLGVKTFICIPLLVDEQAIGTLGLAHPEVVTVDDALLQWLTSLASYIALLMERQQADIALKRSQQQYQALVQSIDGIVWEYDLLSDRFSFVSQKAVEILGYPVAQWLTEPKFWENHLHPDDQAWVISACKTAAQRQQDSLFEYRMVAADQRVVWIQDVMSVVVEQNQSVQLRGVLIDVSERKRIEAEHQQATELLRLQGTALEACADGIVITDRQGMIQWVNPAFSTLTGYTAVEAWGKNPSALVKSGHHQQDFYDQLWTTILSGQVWRGELINRRKDGHLYDEEMTITPVRDSQGEISHFIAIKQDVSDRKTVETHLSALYQQVQQLNATLEAQVEERTTQLQQSLDFEAMLKRITDKVRDSLDEQQILQTVVTELATGLDVSCCDTNLYDLEQRTSTVCAEYTTSLPPLTGKVIPMAEGSNPVIYEQLLQGAYCQFCQIVPSPVRPLQYEFAILACPILDDHGVLGDLWLFRPPEKPFDGLEIRLVQQVANQCAIALRQARLYQAVQHQVETLEHLNQLKDDFLSTVSHELRTPMASIKMATQMLELSFQNLVLPMAERTPIQRYLQILQDECDRETHLINDLLDLCRLDSGTEPLQLTTMNLSMWMMHITESFVDRTRNQHQFLVFNLPADLPPLTADFSYLQRILTELLNNACKYTPAGESISLAVEFHPGANGCPYPYFEIRITNTGVAISPTECDRIFDKFYRIPNNDPWKHGGTGLGLALVKKLVEQMHGSIQVKSNDNAVTFCLQLPAGQL